MLMRAPEKMQRRRQWFPPMMAWGRTLGGEGGGEGSAGYASDSQAVPMHGCMAHMQQSYTEHRCEDRRGAPPQLSRAMALLKAGRPERVVPPALTLLLTRTLTAPELRDDLVEGGAV